jgi:hypothetical protein
MSDTNAVSAMFSSLFRDLREQVTAEIDKRFAVLKTEIISMVEAQADRPRCLTIAEACKEFGFSRSTWDRWAADTTSGLDEVIVRPNGPGGRVLVPVETFERWLRGRHREGRRRRA